MSLFEMFGYFTGAREHAWKYFLNFGLILMGFGILIWVFPEFLVAMIAVLFILAGAFFLGLAWHGKNFEKKHPWIRDDF